MEQILVRSNESCDALMDVADVARRLGIAPSTLYDLAKARKISHHRIGTGRGRLLFTEQDIRTYLDACKVEAGSLPIEVKFTHRRK